MRNGNLLHSGMVNSLNNVEFLKGKVEDLLPSLALDVDAAKKKGMKGA